MKNYSLSVPRIFEVQQLVKRHFPSAEVIVAGGCLRDLLHDVEVKDLDAFVSFGHSISDYVPDKVYGEFRRGIKSLGEALHSTIVEKVRHTYSTFDVVDYPEGVNMYPLQLIFVEEPPVDHIRSCFDFNMCQIWTTSSKVWSTDAYKRGEATRMWEKLKTEDCYKTDWERLQRLKGKYPNWKFRGCESIKPPPVKHQPEVSRG